MKISLPTRLPLAKVLLFSSVLALAELLEGTTPLYVLLVFTFFLVSSLAFNVAGGFTRPSGSFIFFYATLSAGLGTICKAVLGQPAQTHLYSPVLLMSVYTATVLILLVVAFLTRKIATTADGFAGLIHVPSLDFRMSALGCVVASLLINNAIYIFPNGSGSILHALLMVNYFLPLGILLGTISAVRESNGRHSTSAITIFAIVYSTYYGLTSFSKQGMFTPFVCWIIGIAWAKFQLRLKHILAVLIFAYLAQNVFVPLANVGRVDVISGTQAERLAITEKYLEHPLLLRQINTERLNAYAGFDFWYFGAPQGIFDRLTMLPNDAQLVDFSAKGHYFGYLPIYVYFENWVPHIIDENKVSGNIVGGNRYAHEMGQLADADETTGISYTPSAEAFHIDGWTATLLLQPVIYLLLFLTTDAVCGDLRRQPWGLLPMLLFAHIAPEGLLGGAITYVWLGNVATIVAIFVSGYVAPVVGSLLQGRERKNLWSSSIGLPVKERSTSLGSLG